MRQRTACRSGFFHALAATALAAVLTAVDAGAAPSASAETAIPIVQARPDTGSRIRRERVKLFIPAEKPYAELTAEQRAQFRAQFAGLADADEPPYPDRGLRPVAEDLAFALADGKVGKGRLFLTVKVDEKGEPVSVAVFETPDSRTSKEAAAVLMKTRFKPGVCSGKPCPSEFPFIVRLDDE
jgi:hypothetical protein